MSDVQETLQELMERRLRDLGRRRGRGESISLHEAYERLVAQSDGQKIPSYEVFRRIRVAGHTRIKDDTASALATMLEVDVNEVLAAAGIRPRLGRFELPTRADRLNGEQRAVVMGVVDAILTAGEPSAGRRRPGLSAVPSRTSDAVAALEEEVPTVGEQEESETP